MEPDVLLTFSGSEMVSIIMQVPESGMTMVITHEISCVVADRVIFQRAVVVEWDTNDFEQTQNGQKISWSKVYNLFKFKTS